MAWATLRPGTYATTPEVVTFAAAATDDQARRDAGRNRVDPWGRGIGTRDERIRALTAEGTAAEMMGQLDPWREHVRRITRYESGALEADRAGDIVPGLQIRSTRYRTGRLLVFKKDNPEHRFVLVLVPDLTAVEVVGWMRGRYAQRACYWATLNTNRAPCYAVPRGALARSSLTYEVTPCP
jgi:hypothetical protein